MTEPVREPAPDVEVAGAGGTLSPLWVEVARVIAEVAAMAAARTSAAPDAPITGDRPG